jgi:hypothetical protein
MKTNLNDLKSFLELINVKGDIENREINVQSKNGLETLTVNTTKTFSVYGKLNGDFRDLNELGIGNLKLLLTLLNNFTYEEINIEKVNNKLMLVSPNKKLEISYILQNPELIKNTISYDKFKVAYDKTNGDSFNLNPEIISKICSLSRSLGSDRLNVIWNEFGLSVYLENNENTILANFDDTPPNTNQSITIKISNELLDILETINKKPNVSIKMSLKTDCPVILEVKNEKYEIIYLLAPFKK